METFIYIYHIKISNVYPLHTAAGIYGNYHAFYTLCIYNIYTYTYIVAAVQF